MWVYTFCTVPRRIPYSIIPEIGYRPQTSKADTDAQQQLTDKQTNIPLYWLTFCTQTNKQTFRYTDWHFAHRPTSKQHSAMTNLLHMQTHSKLTSSYWLTFCTKTYSNIHSTTDLHFALCIILKKKIYWYGKNHLKDE